MHALKQHTFHDTCHFAVLFLHDIQILRTYDDIHLFVFLKAEIHAVKADIIKHHLVIIQHNARYDIAFPDKIRNIAVLRLIVNIRRCSYLLYFAILHDHDFIRHRQGLFLIMGYIDKGDANLLLNLLQLVLHFLTQLQIQCTKRLIQKQHLRFIHQRTRNCDTLLLSPG